MVTGPVMPGRGEAGESVCRPEPEMWNEIESAPAAAFAARIAWRSVPAPESLTLVTVKVPADAPAAAARTPRTNIPMREKRRMKASCSLWERLAGGGIAGGKAVGSRWCGAREPEERGRRGEERRCGGRRPRERAHRREWRRGLRPSAAPRARRGTAQVSERQMGREAAARR